MTEYYVEVEGHELGLDVSEGQEGTAVRLISPQHSEPHQVDFVPVHYSAQTGAGLYSLLVDGKSYQLYIERIDGGYRVALWGHRFDLRVLSEREWRLQKLAPRQSAHVGVLVVKAPMPGLVKSVSVLEGEQVHAGQRLVVLEAMKMENDINAAKDGLVSKVHIAPGTVVEGGRPLVTLE
jgi:acetyl/propionyl-CoA carboxylase alpha subunit